MKKDLMVTIGGIAATASVVFGCGLFFWGSVMSSGSHPAATLEHSDEHHAADAHEGAAHGESKHAETKDAHEKPEHGEKKGGHEAEGHGKAEAEKPAEPKVPIVLEDIPEELERLTKKYNDKVARGSYDEARSIALQAYALGGQKDVFWLRKMADSTYLSDALPAQQRYSKAYDYYSTLLANTEDSSITIAEREWAQYRACLCLRQSGRWDEALEAAKAYLDRYTDAARRAEVRLMYAQGLFAQGQRSRAREEIDAILKSNPPAEIRARAMIELAQIDTERAKVEPAEAPLASLAEVVNIDDAPATEKPKTVSTDEIAGIPTAQWLDILTAVKKGRLQEAENLLEPWTRAGGPLTEEQRARVTLSFAKVLRESQSQKTAP